MKYRTEYDLKVIGKNLKRLREQNHLTVEWLREYLCLGSVQAIYKYEAGVGYPQADTMLALMELYGVGVNEIVTNQEATAMENHSGFLWICRQVCDKLNKANTF